MDAIRKCCELKAQLETARTTAVALRAGLKNADHMDVTYIDLALETAALRLVYLKKLESAKSLTKKNETAPVEEDSGWEE